MQRVLSTIKEMRWGQIHYSGGEMATIKYTGPDEGVKLNENLSIVKGGKDGFKPTN
jgi:hypothetical protein